MTSDGVITYTHDLAGNMLTAGTDSYTWDWKNRLTGSTVGGRTASYAYDGDDVRVSQTVGGNTSWYVYDRMSGLPLVVDDGTYGYVHAGGVLEQVGGQGTTDWLLDDALGSVRGVADGAGALSGTADYAVFGSVRAQTGTGSTFGFTGEQTDTSTGNVYLRARYHNPATGRFLSPIRCSRMRRGRRATTATATPRTTRLPGPIRRATTRSLERLKARGWRRQRKRMPPTA